MNMGFRPFIHFVILSSVIFASSSQVQAASGNCLATFHARQYADALSLCAEEAKQGSAESAFMLAQIYARGLGVTADHRQALDWLRQAATAGHGEAAYNLGGAYAMGNGLEQDYTQAAYWFELSAGAGNPKAQRDLATLYNTGRGVEQDITKAFLLYRKSAEQGVVVSQLQVGLMLLRGEGAAKDPAEARIWLGHAAEKGNDAAQYMMGVLLAEETPDASTEWFLKAARQGNAVAMHNLALRYYQGVGVEKDLQQARTWAQRSLDQGVEESRGLVERIAAEQQVATAKPAKPGPKQSPKQKPPAKSVAVSRPEPEPEPVAAANAETQTDNTQRVLGTGWLGSRETGRYTLQLARLKEVTGAQRFVTENGLQGPVIIYREALEKRTTYLVLYGDYGSLDEARDEIDRLPAKIQRQKPWIRSYEKLKEAAGLIDPKSVSYRTMPFMPGTMHGERSGDWLLSQPAGQVVVQLLAAPLSQLSRVNAYLARHNLQEETVYYRTQRDAGTYVVVVLGETFDSYTGAKAAAYTLPPAVQRDKPWIRTFGALQGKFRPPEQGGQL